MARRKPVYATLFDLTCSECGHYLIAVGDGAFLACPHGHGKLQVEALPPEDLEEAKSGLWCDLVDPEVRA